MTRQGVEMWSLNRSNQSTQIPSLSQTQSDQSMNPDPINQHRSNHLVKPNPINQSAPIPSPHQHGNSMTHPRLRGRVPWPAAWAPMSLSSATWFGRHGGPNFDERNNIRRKAKRPDSPTPTQGQDKNNPRIPGNEGETAWSNDGLCHICGRQSWRQLECDNIINSFYPYIKDVYSTVAVHGFRCVRVKKMTPHPHFPSPQYYWSS